MTTNKTQPFDESKDRLGYDKRLMAYKEWSKKDHWACSTMLCYMRGDLREFENCLPAKNMWENLKFNLARHLQQGFIPCIRSVYSLFIDLHLNKPKHLQTLGTIVHSLNAIGHKVFEEEQRRKVIRAL